MKYKTERQDRSERHAGIIERVKGRIEREIERESARAREREREE